MTMNLEFYQGTETTGGKDHTSITGKIETKTSNTTLLTYHMPSKKKHTNRLLSPMPSKKKHKNKKRRLEDIAPLYSEDIGTEGIKKSTGAVEQSSISNLPLAEDEEHRRRERKARFGFSKKKNGASQNDDEPGGLSSSLSSTIREQKKSDQSSLVGTSTFLEKSYFRLTTFPKAQNVRPLPVLIKSLAHIKGKYVKTEDFDWANEQLKSVRQDITVQHIRNKFVLEVYQTHARILLEQGDLDEFHQCQTMIRNLTSTGANLVGMNGLHEDHVVGCDEDEECLKETKEAADEFQAYGMLYNLVQNSWGELTKVLTTSCDMMSDTASVTSSDGDIPACVRGSSLRHALRVVKAVMHNDYQAFFRLYESAPHLSAYLMDFLVRRVRNTAYERIIAAYRPTVSVEHFREALFIQDLEETRRFLRKSGAIFIHEQGGPPFWVDCKATFASCPNMK